MKRHSLTNKRLVGYTPKSTPIERKQRLGILIGIALFFVAVAGIRWYTTIIRDLPDISEIENFTFKEATVITDRNGEVLYRLFDENREYVWYENISPYFVNALVATEDQRFRENPGVDRKWTLRAGLTDLRYGKTHGGSTITQQLIKNVMLTPEKKLERKLKEIILAVKLSKYIKKDIRKKFNDLTDDEVDQKVKEKVLELYANLIFLGNNSYGVETASQMYFAKPAADLDILEAAILAGIPQAPSRYDPYTNRDALMGKLVVTDTDDTPVELDEGLKNALYDKIQQSIDNADFSFKRDDSAILQYFKGLLSFRLTYQGQNYEVSYEPGRKDAVLARMYEEGYITEVEFKKSFSRSFTFTFERGSVTIKAPHFVFRIISLLEEQYDQELLRKEGLTITTSLDYNIQKIAETTVTEQDAHLKWYQANNASLLYMDSQNGDVLAYVGSKDYHNDEIDGQVDIIQSMRQPGSTMKPLLYSLGFMKLPLTLDTPIYDIKYSIGRDTPNNADGTFKGLMPIRTALAGSRNIPAIKMFFAVGGEKPFKEFLSKIGITSLDKENDHYGYPLAIGAGELQMFQLAKAYTHLSAMGKPAEVNPILEIRGSDGSLLYKKQVKLEQQVIPAGVAYLLRSILSDNSNMPAGWSSTFTIPGLTLATKSGTTNVVKGNQKLPRDGWLVTYTPSKVLVMRAGNTDGSALRADAYGGWLNNPMRKNFIKRLKDNAYLQDERPQQMEVKTVTIARTSWKLASFDTPLAFTKKTLGYLQTLPTEVDANIQKIEIDTLCNGATSELTPPSDIKEAYLLTPETVLPYLNDADDVKERRETTWKQAFEEEVGAPVFLEALTGSCAERETIAENGEISLTIMQPTAGQKVTREFSLRHQTTSPFKIKAMKLYLWTVELKSFSYNREGNLIDISTVKIPDEIDPGTYDLKAVVFDEKWFSDSRTIKITLINDDTSPPSIMDDKVKVTKTPNGTFEIVMLFSDDASLISTGIIEQGGQKIHEFEWNVAVFESSTLDDVSYSITDAAGNEGKGTISLKAN